MGKGNTVKKAPTSKAGAFFEMIGRVDGASRLEEEDEVGLAASVDVDPAGAPHQQDSRPEDKKPRSVRKQSLDSAIEDWDMAEFDEVMEAPQAPEEEAQKHGGREVSSPQRQQLVATGDDGDGDGSGKTEPSDQDPKRISWKAYGCYISAGGDILSSPRRVTVLEAKRLCAQTPDCRGFTFSGKAPASKKRPVHFKNKFDCGGKGGGWTALKRIEIESEVKPLWKQKPLAAPWRKPSLPKVREVFKNLTVLSVDPPVWQFDNFLSEEEISALRGAGASVLEGVEKPVGGFSAGRSVWLSREEDLSNPLLKAVETRVARLVGLPEKNLEPTQVVHYGVGDGYSLHHDRLETQSRQACGVRVATFLMYLGGSTRLGSGGETRFPELGFSVVPRPGRALLWWNVDPAQIEQGMPHQMDRRLVHEALPVEAGEKWAVNKWIHMNDFQTPYFARSLV